PRISIRILAYPCPAKYGCRIESRIAVKSFFRYGRYSKIAGTGCFSASTGNQISAASSAPSDMGIRICSIFLISRGNSVIIFWVSDSFTLKTNLSNLSVKLLDVLFSSLVCREHNPLAKQEALREWLLH